jgi:carbon-monoxide dehydrogenase medium subunit
LGYIIAEVIKNSFALQKVRKGFNICKKSQAGESAVSSYQLHNPRHIKEAVDMMTNLEDAWYISGGTKLMPLITHGKVIPKHLISIGNIADIQGITRLNGVRLGSGLTLTEVKDSAVLKHEYTAIYDSICARSPSKKGENGTLGGDICSAYPFARLAGPMFLFDAEVAAAGMYPATHQEGMGVKGGFFGSRIIRIDSFFTTRDSTILKKDELVKEFILPFLPEHTGSAFIQIKQGKSRYFGLTGIGARISVSSQDGFVASRKALEGKRDLAHILATFAESGLLISDVRLVAVSSRDLPRRMHHCEDELKGNVLSGNTFSGAIQAAVVEAMKDIKGKADSWYMREVFKVLLGRAIIKAINRAISLDESIHPEVAW